MLSAACLGANVPVAHAEPPQTNANTPKLALHKMELWLALAEPKPSVADIDAGVGVTGAVEERMTMLNTELGAVASRRRTLMLQAAVLRKKAADLKAERDAPSGENGIKRAGSEGKILELEQKAAALDAQAETLYQQMHRIGDEERVLVEAVGRVKAVTGMIETSTIADAKQKQKAAALSTKTNKLFRIHASVIMTMMNATAGAAHPTSS